MESVQEKEAVALTPELKQAYADIIGILFNNVITATADQISDDVVRDVDSMMAAIANCSQKLSELGFEIIYNIIVKRDPLKSIINEFRDALSIKGYVKGKVEDKIKETIREWVLKLSSNYQWGPCLNSARVNWKSRIELDLLGI